MVKTTQQTEIATRPVVMRSFSILGLSDAEIARLLGHSRPTISQWAHGVRPIPPVTHAALWYVVARVSGALGPDDPPMLPAGVGPTRWGDDATRVGDVLARAAMAVIANAPDEETVSAGAVLGQKILDRLEIEARKERLAELDSALAQLEDMERAFEEYKREAGKVSNMAGREVKNSPAEAGP